MKEEIVVQLLENDNHRKDDGSSPTLDTMSSQITPMLLLSAFTAVLGSFSFGFVTAYSSPVQAEIMKELDLSIDEYSLFGSIYTIGGALGAIMCGKIIDYFGRNHAIFLSDVVYVLGWFSISVGQVLPFAFFSLWKCTVNSTKSLRGCLRGKNMFFNRVWILDIGRWMLGVAMAVSGYAIPVYIAEFTPKNYRGGFVILHALMLAVGSSAAFLFGLITSWRTLALIGMIPSLVQIVGLYFIPESPRWLLMMKRNKKFEEALQRLRGGSTDISKEAADIRDCAEALNQLDQVSILQLFQRKYAYSLTVGIGLSAMTMLVGLSGIICYASSIFESAGIPVIMGSIALAIIQLLSAGFGIILMDKAGRRPLLMISAAGLCLGCVLAGSSFLLEEHHVLGSLSPYLALTGILVYVASYPIGVGGASSIIISEIYPLNIKGLAGSVAALASWLSAWIVTYVFNFTMEWSSSGTFFIFATICAITLMFVNKLVPETKGKTLEEVHMSISDVWQ